jgi:hypothetical protein
VRHAARPHLLAALLATLLAPLPPAGAQPPALVGQWELDPGRTRYGPGVDPRRRERFACAAAADGRLACTIRGERADGRVVSGRFTAPTDGSAAPVAGVPGVDAVRLRAVSASIADATFYFRRAPAFGYRAYRSSDDRTLLVVPVDPVTRAALTTVVVYARR